MPLWFVHNGLDNPLFLALQRIIRRRLKIESLMQFILELIGNAIVEQISRNQDGNFTGVVHLEGYKTTVLKLTWLLEIIELVGFDYLITKKK
ncbi:hypothetical protein CICLE_v10004035mg, partial [Citrus x clementina]